MFSRNICEIFQKNYFEEHLRTTDFVVRPNAVTISESASINPSLNCWVDVKDTIKNMKLVQNHQYNMSNYLNLIYFQACNTISSSDHQDIRLCYIFKKTASMLSLFPGVSWFLDIVSRKLIAFQPIFLQCHHVSILTRKRHPQIKRQRLQEVWTCTFGSSVHQINS